MSNDKKSEAFTLVELLVVVAIIALLISILLPSLQSARESAKKVNCAANVRSIGSSCYIYQESNQGQFPAAAHMTNSTSSPVVNYIGNMGGSGSPGLVRDQVSIQGPGGTGTALVSTTRSLWMLVRGGGIIPKNFICPSSLSDVQDPTVDTTTYYDFIGFGTSSYGYQVPYDTTNTCKPSPDVDPRMVLAGDRGPWSVSSEFNSQNSDGDSEFFTDAVSPIAQALFAELISEVNPTAPAYIGDVSPPDRWKRYNSPNHGGQNNGAGQNVLFPDGHAVFVQKPTAGVDSDNIYTKMGLGSGATRFDQELQWGTIPDENIPIIPGFNSLNNTNPSFTDTLLWP